MANIPELRKILEHVEDEVRVLKARYPDNPFLDRVQWAGDWDQSSWGIVPVVGLFKGKKQTVSCATACCFAGHAVLQAGASFYIDEDDWDEFDDAKQELYVHRCKTAEGEILPIVTHAREILGLTPIQAERLFASGNNAKTLRNLCEEIASQQGETL